MSTNFPTTLDTSTTLPAESASTVLATNHVTAHQNIQDALEAVEAKIGVDSSAVTTSHDYKLGEILTTDKAVGKTATQTLTNKTLTSPTLTTPVLNVGSDATGDIYYRNAGVLTRLPVGANGTILKLAAGVPSWATETVTVDASTTAKGIVEIATDAEVNAGTGTGGTGAILVIPASSAGAVAANKIVQFTAATKYPVADGSLITNVGVRKTGSFTKDMSTSTTTTQAHGLGFTPKFVRITVNRNQTSAAFSNNGITQSIGTYDGTTQNCNYIAFCTNGNSSAQLQDTTNGVHYAFGAGASADADKNVGAISVDGTNITITWTITGSPTGTGNFIWEAYY